MLHINMGTITTVIFIDSQTDGQVVGNSPRDSHSTPAYIRDKHITQNQAAAAAIGDSNGRVTMGGDGWTSGQNRHFIGFEINITTGGKKITYINRTV